MALGAFGAKASLPAASLQGFSPSAGWGRRRWISPRAAALALLGFVLPGAFPFRASASAATAPLSRATRRNPAASSVAAGALRSASSRHFRTHPFWVLLPVLQSFKELGSWLASPEAAGPLRFSSSSLPCGRVSDRLSALSPIGDWRQGDSRYPPQSTRWLEVAV
jgi:hypothetical protein